MILPLKTDRLFSALLLAFLLTFIPTNLLSQKAWEEPFQVTQLNRYSKGKFDGYFQLDNFTKNEKKSAEKAKQQILYQLIYRGVEENNNFRLARIKPIPLIQASALEIKEGQSDMFTFIEMQGQESIVSIVYAGKDQSPNKDHVSWFIDVDMKKLADLLEAAHFKKSIQEFYGTKLKAFYCPKDITDENFYQILNDSKARSMYVEEFELLKNEYADQFEWVSLIDYAKEINSSIKENEKKRREVLTQLIVRTLSIDVLVQFNTEKISKGTAGACRLIFMDAFDFRELEIPRTLNLVGGINVTSLLPGYLKNRNDVFDEVIQLTNSIYNGLYEGNSRGKEYWVRLSINPRLNKKLSDVILVENEKYTLLEIIESVMSQFSNRSSFYQAGNENRYRFNYGMLGSKLICHDVEFQSRLNQKMKEISGFQFEYEFIGCNTINLILTDLTEKERQVKMKEDFEQAKQLNTKMDYEAYLKKYPDSDKATEVAALINKIVEDDRKTQLQAANSENTLNAYRNFLLTYGVANYEDPLYSEASNLYNELFNELVKANALSTTDLLAVFKDGFISADEVIVLDPLYASVLPANWEGISSLDEINKVISDLHLFLKNTFEKDKSYLLDHDIFTKLDCSTYDMEGQDWTYANLNVSHFNNGDSISEVRTEEEWAQAGRDKKPAWCHFNNDETQAYSKGKLYNWYALTDPRGIVPKGYRLPSLDDFLQLAKNCGGIANVGVKFKCPYSWGEESEETNEDMGTYSHFGLIPFGIRDQRGFMLEEEVAAFWTATSKSESNANYVFFMKGKNDMNVAYEASKSAGLSVRIIKEHTGEEEVGNYSEVMNKLELKRNQLILKEFGALKKYDEIGPFLMKQLLKELELPVSYGEDIDPENVNVLLNRFFDDEEVIKNGVYFRYFDLYGRSACNFGEGGDFGGVLEDKIGFVNNVQNYILYEDGSYYKGELQDASPSGSGLLVILEDNEFGDAGRYEGQFEGGYLSNGKISYTNRNVYVGQCEGNVPNGTGKMTLASGKILDGEFKNGEYIKPFTCKQVKIGDKIWMAENLNVDHFRNGDEIPEAKTIAEWTSGGPAWCYYNNDPSNAAKFGKLYNAAALNDPRGLAPEGWHIPSHVEFNQLIDDAQPKVNALKQKIENAKSQGIDYYNLERSLFKMLSNDDQSKQIASYTLRSATGWGNNANGTNVTGFNAYPSRYRSAGGTFETSEIDTRYWTSSRRSSNGVVSSYISYSLFTIPMFYLYSEYRYVYTDGPVTDEYLNNVGLAVRCVKN